MGFGDIFKKSFVEQFTGTLTVQSLLLSLMFGAFGALTNFAVHRTDTANNKIKKLEVK